MSLPLTGQRIVVTRAAHQAEELAEPLRRQGADVILLPAIEIAPPENPQPLENALAQLDRYDWIVFTSANGIKALGARISPSRARVATVGAATRQYAEQNGWTVNVTPENYVAENLVAALETEDLTGKRILIPSAAVTRDAVREALSKRGALVDLVEAYRNVAPPDLRPKAQATYTLSFPHWTTFASSSAVEHLAAVVAADDLRRSKIASIGPITSRTIASLGLCVDAEAEPHTVPGLVNAIIQAVAANTA